MKKTWVLLLVLAGLAPVIWYAAFIGHAPAVVPEQVRARLAGMAEKALLVDISLPESFQKEHIRGSVNWPLKEIKALRTREEIPGQYRGKTLFLLCPASLESAVATTRLRGLGMEAFNVEGGLQAWGAGLEKDAAGPFESLVVSGCARKPFPFQAMSFFEQTMACVAAFGVKPLYMILSFILILVLGRARGGDMAALRTGLVFFLAGETFCAVNYLFLGEQSLLVEYLHIYGMVLGFCFVALALLEAVDQRVLFLSDQEKKCAALALCEKCAKFGPHPCGLRRFFMFGAGALAFLCFLPLAATLVAGGYSAVIFGAQYHYSHPVIYQIFETKYAPAVALVFFLAAFGVLWRNRPAAMDRAKALVSAGLGFFGFGVFRMVLYYVFRDNLAWYIIWEELTELLFVGGTGLVLWIFRKSLFPQKE